jgi:hypothetical protein
MPILDAALIAGAWLMADDIPPDIAWLIPPPPPDIPPPPPPPLLMFIAIGLFLF